MARRRNYRRRYKKKDSIEDIAGPVFGLIVIFSIVTSISVDGSELAINFPKLFTLVFLCCVAVLVVYAVILMIRNGIVGFFGKLFRGKLFSGSHTIEDLISMHPRTFEHYVGGMFENQGYKVEKVTQYSADHGIDVMLRKDGKRYAVQAKRYSGRNFVKAHEVRDFYGSYSYEGDKFDGGIFVTTSYFGKQAKAWAKQRGMILVDRPALSTMIRGFDFE